MSNMGVSQIINDLALSLGFVLPSWAGPVSALFVFVLCFPIFLRNARAARARKLLKRSDLSSGQERERLEKKALDLVASNPHGLLTLADTAHKLNRYSLATEILEKLPNRKKINREARRLRKKMTPRGELTADSAASAIDNLLTEGMVDAAEERLTKALMRWPNESHLLALRAKIDSTRLNAVSQAPAS